VAAAASASSPEYAKSGIPSARTSPLAVAAATRTPVKDPGPPATTTAPSPAGSRPEERSAKSIAGSSDSECFVLTPTTTSARSSLPRPTATLPSAVDVSIARYGFIRAPRSSFAAAGSRERWRVSAAHGPDQPLRSLPVRTRRHLDMNIPAIPRQERLGPLRPLDHHDVVARAEFAP